MLKKRSGEKIGWTAGWLGGFVWVAALSVVFLVQRKWIEGILGLILCGISVLSILLPAPWRYPSTPYWKLMVVPYAVFLGSAGWAIWAFDGIKTAGFDAWSLLWLVPLLIPFGVLSKRTWKEKKKQ